MRIVHVATRHVPYGSARNLAFTMAREVYRGHQVTLITGGVEAPVSDGVNVIVMPDLVPQPSPWHDLTALSKIRRWLRANPHDVLHTHQSKAGALGRLAARGKVPVIVHTIHMSSFGSGYSPVASRAFLTVEQICATFTDLFIAVGQDIAERYLAAGVGRTDQFTVIQSPVGIEQFIDVRGTSGATRGATRQRHGLNAKSVVFVGAGLLEPRKRYAEALYRLAPLLRSTDSVFALAGAGSEETRLRRMSTDLGVAGKVRLLGHLADLPDLFAACDVLVHTSRVEGIPQVVIQALAAGLPVVSTEVEGLVELLPAPITIVRRNLEDLEAAAAKVANSPRPTPVPITRFEPWTTKTVAAKLHDFQDRLQALVNRVAASPRGSSSAVTRE